MFKIVFLFGSLGLLSLVYSRDPTITPDGHVFLILQDYSALLETSTSRALQAVFAWDDDQCKDMLDLSGIFLEHLDSVVANIKNEKPTNEPSEVRSQRLDWALKSLEQSRQSCLGVKYWNSQNKTLSEQADGYFQRVVAHMDKLNKIKNIE